MHHQFYSSNIYRLSINGSAQCITNCAYNISADGCYEQFVSPRCRYFNSYNLKMPALTDFKMRCNRSKLIRILACENPSEIMNKVNVRTKQVKPRCHCTKTVFVYSWRCNEITIYSLRLCFVLGLSWETEAALSSCGAALSEYWSICNTIVSWGRWNEYVLELVPNLPCMCVPGVVNR